MCQWLQGAEKTPKKKKIIGQQILISRTKKIPLCMLAESSCVK